MEWPVLVESLYLSFSRIFDGFINFLYNIKDYLGW